MGASGPGPFENDEAMDFTDELQRAGAEIWTRLRSALESEGGGTGATSIAAAAVLAAAAGRPVPGTPAHVLALVARRPWTPNREDLESAVRRVRQLDRESEFQQLWDESGGEAWHATNDLLVRMLDSVDPAAALKFAAEPEEGVSEEAGDWLTPPQRFLRAVRGALGLKPPSVPEEAEHRGWSYPPSPEAVRKVDAARELRALKKKVDLALDAIERQADAGDRVSTLRAWVEEVDPAVWRDGAARTQMALVVALALDGRTEEARGQMAVVRSLSEESDASRLERIGQIIEASATGRLDALRVAIKVQRGAPRARAQAELGLALYRQESDEASKHLEKAAMTLPAMDGRTKLVFSALDELGLMGEE